MRYKFVFFIEINEGILFVQNDIERALVILSQRIPLHHDPKNKSKRQIKTHHDFHF